MSNLFGWAAYWLVMKSPDAWLNMRPVRWAIPHAATWANRKAQP